MAKKKTVKEEVKVEAPYFEGKTFVGTYPPEAAIWCNSNGHHIEAVKGQDYNFIIVKNEEYVPTASDILAQKEAEYDMNRWQREGILAEGSNYSEYTKAKAQELEDLAAQVRKEQGK